MDVRIDVASRLALPEIAALFNAGYSGYIVPVNVTEAYIQNHIRQFDVALEHSPVAFDGERPVGFAFLAVRDKRGWVAGVGVVPEARKQGVGRRVMQGLFERARDAGLDTVQLEVIVGNDAAHHLYESLGMRDVRRVLVLQRAPAEVGVASWDGALQDTSAEAALESYAALHSSENPWQRLPRSILQATPAYQARVAVKDGAVKGYVIGSFNADRIAIVDVGVDPTQPDAFAAVMTSLHAEYPQAPASFTNLDAADAAWPVLESLGYTARLQQDEMKLDLAAR